MSGISVYQSFVQGSYAARLARLVDLAFWPTVPQEESSFIESAMMMGVPFLPSVGRQLSKNAIFFPDLCLRHHHRKQRVSRRLPEARTCCFLTISRFG